MSRRTRTTDRPLSLLRSRGAVIASLVTALAGAVGAGSLITAAVADPHTSAARSIVALVPQADPRSLSGDAWAASAPGSCVTWTLDGRDAVRSFTVVDCGQPHRFEVAARIDLRFLPGFGDSAPFPGPEQRKTVGREQCGPAVNTYAVGHPIDPAGRFAATVIPPSEQGWDKGDHSVLCGVAAYELDGRSTESTGRFADADQQRLWGSGVCLGFATGGLPGAPVPCAEDHSIEIVSRLDARPLLVDGPKPPSPQDQAKQTADACRAAGADYLGDTEQLRRSTLISTLVFPISPVSWAAGSRAVNCGLMKARQEGGFVTLRGAARQGPLLDGAQPVAPTTTMIPPPGGPTSAAGPGVELPRTGAPPSAGVTRP